jgi:HSP20 family molecular chaperone IbpA
VSEAARTLRGMIPLTLPDEVDFEKAIADINHGVLKIRLPKRSESKPRTIPIRPA